VEASLSRDIETFGKMDPYVKVKAKGQNLRTRVLADAGKTAVWNQEFVFRIMDKAGECEVEVWD
jgi:hypothetical protein